MSLQIVEELAAKLGLEVDGEAFAVAEKMLAVVRGGMVAAAAAGAAVGAAVLGAAVKTAAYADQVEKASQRTGIAVESLQALQYAAERADVSAGDLEGALRFAAKRGVKDLEGELRRAAGQFERMPDGAEKSALAMKLFGKNGAALIPMLNKGTAGLDEMMQKARDMGLVLDEETIVAGAELKDAIEDLQGYLIGLSRTIAGPFLKPLKEIVLRMTDWLRANRQLIAQRVEVVARVIGTAFKYAFQLIEPVVDILFRFGNWMMSSTWGQIVTALMVFGAVITAPWLGAVLAIGLFLGALEEVWGWITGKRDTLLGDWLGPFDEFKKGFENNPIVQMLEAIADAAEKAADGLSKIARLATFLKTGTTPEIQDHQDYSKNLSEAYRRTGLAEVPGAEFAVASDPTFNDLVRAGDFETLERKYGRHSLFRKQQESLAAGYSPAAAAAPAGSFVRMTFGDIHINAADGTDAGEQFVTKVREQLGIEFSAALPAAAR
jgi:hypothetical protein